MAIDKSKLERLSPKEWIDRLKELEKKLDEKHKKEVEEIGTLIKRSMQQLRTEKLADKIAPEQKEVEMSGLFERDNERLERTVNENAPASMGRDYHIISQVYQDYSELKAMEGIVSQGYNLTSSQRALVGMIGERINIVEKYMTDSEKTASVLNPSRAILYKIKKEVGID